MEDKQCNYVVIRVNILNIEDTQGKIIGSFEQN